VSERERERERERAQRRERKGESGRESELARVDGLWFRVASNLNEKPEAWSDSADKLDWPTEAQMQSRGKGRRLM